MSASLCEWRLFLLITTVVIADSDTAEKLLGKFGTNYTMDEKQTAKLFDSMGISNWDFDNSAEEVKGKDFYHF